MEPDFEQESTWSKFKNNFLELIEFAAIIGVIVLVVHYLIAEPHQVSGNSMFPNFHNGEYIITNKLATRFSQIQRREIIIFTSPREANKVFIKRVIGLPADSIKIQGGQIFVNGQPLDEPYLPPTTRTPAGSYLAEGEEIVVPQGQYFVVGDNRTGSSDSREWGPVKRELIIGQAWLRYWPIQKFGLIEHYRGS